MSAPPPFLRSKSYRVPPRQVPSRSISGKIKRERNIQANECHAKLERMERGRSKLLAERMSWLTIKQDMMRNMVLNALAETIAVESFIDHLIDAQKQLVDDLKESLRYDGAYFEEETVLGGPTDCDVRSVSTNATSVAAVSMHKSTSLMVLKIYNLGIKNLLEVLARVRRVSKILKEQQTDLERLGRIAVKALIESQVQVQQAWEKYCQDALGPKNVEKGQIDSSIEHLSFSDDSQSQQSKSTLKSRSGSENGSTGSSSVPKFVMEPLPNASGRSSAQGRTVPDFVGDPMPSHRFSKDNSLRAMTDAAGLADSLPSPDVWLSEWSYRAHVMEQVILCDGAIKRMKHQYQLVEKTEVMRRRDVQQALVVLTKSQQKLAVNLQAASSMGLMDYWEWRQRLDESTDDEDIESSENENSPVQTMTFYSSDKDPGSTNAGKTLWLPPLTKSGFVMMANLVERTESDKSRPLLSIYVMTSDGILYFFDLPKDSGLSLKSTNAQAWGAILGEEFKLLMKNSSDGEDGAVIAVPPPMPTSHFVMTKCSFERTVGSSIVKFIVPKSAGKSFFIRLPSTCLVNEFIANFHACKFQVEESASTTDKDGSDSMSDASTLDDRD